MVPFIYRCPVTGLKVQGLFADEVPPESANTYEPVTCLACTRVHLVNRSSGKTLDEDDEWVPGLRICAIRQYPFPSAVMVGVR